VEEACPHEYEEGGTDGQGEARSFAA
jgi:hypothetical protein